MKIRKLIFLTALFTCFSILPLSAATKEGLVKQIETSEETVKHMMSSPDTSIPQHFLKEAYAVIFMRQYKAGFGIGAKGGNGIIIAKDIETGEWSPPAFIATAEGSFGFQIGVKMVDAIILIMNEEGLTLLLKSPLKIGGEISVAAGPVGREAGLKAGLPATGMLIYSRARGAFIGASFEGGLIVADAEANKTFYGIDDIKPREILLDGRVEMPQEAMSLIEMLKKYEQSE